MWKVFLTDSKVSDWIQEELALVQASELNKLLSNISNPLVGRAQPLMR